MSLFALGVNHNTASVAEREKIAFPSSEVPIVVRDLFERRAVEEAVVLSTCNRTEIYAVTKCHHAVKEWLRCRHQAQALPVVNKLYEHHDTQVIRHLMSVASGLDSMIIGEPQILGQLKQAYHTALENGTVGKQFQQLFPAVFETAKLVRTKTDIGNHAVTMAYAVIQLAKGLFPAIQECVVALLGSGETVELLAEYLHQHQVKRVMIINRTLARAHHLARRYHGVPMRMEKMPNALVEADIVISAVAARQPLVSEAVLKTALQQRQHRHLFMADLGVPRNVEASAAYLDGLHLYNMDDLQSIVKQNQQSRTLAADKARAMVQMQAAHYLRLLRVREAGHIIRQYRCKMESWRDEVLNQTLKKLNQDQDAAELMRELATQLTKKFMHLPTVKMREACYAQEVALLDLIKDIYEL